MSRRHVGGMRHDDIVADGLQRAHRFPRHSPFASCLSPEFHNPMTSINISSAHPYFLTTYALTFIAKMFLYLMDEQSYLALNFDEGSWLHLFLFAKAFDTRNLSI